MVKQDLILRMYNEAFRNNHAHYGLWEPGEQLTMNNLRKAMQRYTNKLISTIPNGVKSVLDAGCGWGGSALELEARGYDVVALSPDTLQRDHFEGLHSGIEFVLSTFEGYTPSRRFDLVLMSESCQYINPKEGAKKSCEIIPKGGYVLVADYFVKSTGADSIVRRWGHSLDDYLRAMKDSGFTLVTKEDVTEAVLPTLQLAQQMYEDVIRPVFRFLFGVFEQRYSTLFKGVSWVLNKVSKDGIEKMLLSDDPESKKIVDVNEFRRNKAYMILLFQKNVQ